MFRFEHFERPITFYHIGIDCFEIINFQCSNKTSNCFSKYTLQSIQYTQIFKTDIRLTKLNPYETSKHSFHSTHQFSSFDSVHFGSTYWKNGKWSVECSVLIFTHIPEVWIDMNEQWCWCFGCCDVDFPIKKQTYFVHFNSFIHIKNDWNEWNRIMCSGPSWAL